MISHAAENDYDIFKMDITQAFTQSIKFPPHVKIYMYPPPGYLPKGRVLQLLGPLYGLSRASAYWSRTVRIFLVQDGWQKVTPNDDTIWRKTVKTNDGKRNMDMLLEYHVDDFLLTAHPSCSVECSAFKKRLLTRFAGKDEGKATRFLGLDIHRVGKRIYMTQAPLIQQLIDDLGLQDANPSQVPMTPGTCLSSIEGQSTPNVTHTKFFQHTTGLMQYIYQNTRPDIGFVTHELSKQQCNPGEVHLDAAKMAGRYLKGTINLGPVYGDTPDGEKGQLWAAADSDWATCKDSRKSISAHYVRWNRGPLAWVCKQQDGVATSTTEAEYVSASTCAKKVVYLTRLLAGLGSKVPKPVVIFEDNRGCRLMSENATQSSRTRHIDTARHNVCDLVEKLAVRLIDCPTADNPADLLTKALPPVDFKKHRDTVLGYTALTAPINATIIPLPLG
jgi:hypothetical protein